MRKAGVAMIGVGSISGIYLKNIANLFPDIALIGVCDLVRERAERARAAYGVPKLYETMHDAFADPDVDIVLNLTRPYEHFEVTRAALLAGKHVYSEKPLGVDMEEGRELARLAEARGLLLGGAPDTFLGAGIQTCRKLIDDGAIGDVVGAACCMICRGHESWHPDPAFYYKRGGGPMLDMGPYYVTALVNLLGGVSGVTGMVKASFPTRLITSAPYAGTVVEVEVPTHLAGMLRFESGAIGTILTTFDAYYPQQARFEIYGSKGTLFVPDPNTFGGTVQLFGPGDDVPREAPLMFGYDENSRALGLNDMARALLTGAPFRADCAQTLHVLEILTAFQKSSEDGAYRPLETKFTRKPPLA